MTKAPTKAESAHIGRVKSMPCVICSPTWFIGMAGSAPNMDYGYRGCDYDHFVDGYRLGHPFGIPLCPKHHDGKKGHGPVEYHWDSSKPNQWKLLEMVYRVLGKPIPDYVPKGRNNFNPTN